MNLFRPLTPEEIECRISQVSEKGVTLLLYKTARTDAALLDEVFTPMGWQNNFEFKNGILYGGIGIFNSERNEWIWKWDCGTESNMEAEKGQASDAFKRAGFKWGIGRELYTAPFIFVSASKCKIIDGRKCYDKFEVATINYKGDKIATLTIVNPKTNEAVFVYGGKPITSGLRPATEIAESAPRAPKCEICGKEIESVKGYDAAYLANERRKTFGKAMCYDCFRQAKIAKAKADLAK